MTSSGILRIILLMSFIQITCSYCGKDYLKEKGRINEAIKFNWNQYCSLSCQIKAKTKNIQIKCGNPLCNKEILRKPSAIPPSGIGFCSRTCSAIVNNPKSSKRRKKIRTCPKCGNNFTGRRKYCSSSCFPDHEIYPADKIIEEIKQFYNTNKRVPFKFEYLHARAARSRFGTWNNAIKTAGLKPNPVRFANKFIAKDGHKCDSLSEKIIDDWLFGKKVIHQRNVQYLNTLFTADFKVKDIYIEFFGLHNQLKKYDQLMKTKLKIIKDNHLKLISIYSKDIFPKSRLNEILNGIINC